MFRPTPSRQWLAEHSADWCADGLISAEQQAAILARYPAASAGGTVRLLLSLLGALAIGLGVILFFAFNWDALHRSVKLGALFAALLAAHAAGLRWQRPGSSQRALGVAASLLGTLLFGAGLWLVSQVYFIDSHFPNAFLAWGLAALAMAWVLPSIWQGLLAVCLLDTWGLLEALRFDDPRWLAPLILATLLPLALARRSRALLAAVTLSLLGLLAFAWSEHLQRSGFALLYFAALACLAAGMLLSRLRPALAVLRPALTVPAHLWLLGTLLALSFVAGHGDHALDWWFRGSGAWQWSWLAAVPAWAVVLLALAPPRTQVPVLAPAPAGDRALLLAAFASSIVLQSFALPQPPQPPLPPALLALLANLGYLAHALLLLAAGARAGRGGVVTAGFLAAALLVVLRFFDLFDSLLLRSLAFVLVGVGLFLIGHWQARRRAGAAS